MRVYNFSAGPSMLPLEVLERARDELLDYRGSGMSVMEISHRSPGYQALAHDAETRLRRLLLIPDDYRVLFLQGGATGQFAAIPLNLACVDSTVAYLDSGIWSSKAIEEAKRFVSDVTVVASSGHEGYKSLPLIPPEAEFHKARYLHYTSNETIGGLEFQVPPESGSVPLIADMSSNLLTRVLDIPRYGLIYAGAQKNLGPAGVTVVIVREDLLGEVPSRAPAILDYARQSLEGSMLNTPATYSWYLLGQVLLWLESCGGVPYMESESARKAALLYEAIDGSDFYHNDLEPASRSRINVPFKLPNLTLERMFTEKAAAAGLVNLEGHRSVGGLRASLYNAMPFEGVATLVHFMSEFERSHG